MGKYIIALDEGTTSTRSVLYDVESGRAHSVKSIEIAQQYPAVGWVEESAEEIYASTLVALIENVEKAGAENVCGIGVTNQRETVIAWDRKSGKPLYNAIIWQCRRTQDYCKRIESEYGDIIYKKTGLKIDPYFSASKMRWLLDNVPAIAAAEKEGTLCFGTVESYLIFRLTKGASYVTDYTNASRTMLFNIKTMEWDDQLASIFKIDKKCLPKVVSPDSLVGYFDYDGVKIPIAGLAGDQQSSAVGQKCFNEGDTKITYGTGMFMLTNAGGRFINSTKGILTTLGYAGRAVYMLEGSVFNAGSAVQWLRDGLDFFENSAESEALATSVDDSNGVYVVPAFTGLGAPYWRSDVTGLITGITRATTKAHVTRAVLEGIAYSAKDVLDAVVCDTGCPINKIKVDGGASKNNFLMQFQADVLGSAVERHETCESTALGAVYLCMIALGIKTYAEISKSAENSTIFEPSASCDRAKEGYTGWQKAVRKVCL